MDEFGLGKIWILRTLKQTWTVSMYRITGTSMDESHITCSCSTSMLYGFWILVVLLVFNLSLSLSLSIPIFLSIFPLFRPFPATTSSAPPPFLSLISLLPPSFKPQKTSPSSKL